MAEVIAFISDSHSWKMRVSSPLLKIFSEEKVLFAAAAFAINIHTQLLHHSAAAQHLIYSTFYLLLGCFLNCKLLGKRVYCSLNFATFLKLTEFVFSDS